MLSRWFDRDAAPKCRSVGRTSLQGHGHRNHVVAAYLERLLKQTSGVTFVVSESDYLRTFVAAALVHSFAAQRPNRTIVSGYDVHAAHGFVPIDGVTYLDVWKRPESIEAAFGERKLEPAAMVYLNDVYSKVPAVRANAQTLSAKAHVVIAERTMPARDLSRFSTPKHLIVVAADRHARELGDDASAMTISLRDVA